MEAYYADLSEHYDVKIRQLVPGYDEMVACIVDHLRRSGSSSILEIGSGVGNLAEQVVEGVDCSSLTAVEVSDGMMAQARARLASADRVSLVHRDILDFVPDRSFDAVYSNLVLHNIPYADKSGLLRRIHEWIESGGLFVWADLVCYDDSGVQDRFVRARVEHARAAGCPEDLIELNFEKEGTEDFPLTIEATIDAASAAGFADARVVWTRDTFAVFVLDT